MPFTFRLEKVLSVRRIQQDAAQQRCAEAQQALDRCVADRGALQGQLQAAFEDLDAHKRRDALTPQLLHLHAVHADSLRARLAEAERRVASAESDLAEASAALLEAHRAREALEKLREREQAAWQRSQKQAEARHVDELAVSRHRARQEEDHGP